MRDASIPSSFPLSNQGHETITREKRRHDLAEVGFQSTRVRGRGGVTGHWMGGMNNGRVYGFQSTQAAPVTGWLE
jgi:hypothetical protein